MPSVVRIVSITLHVACLADAILRFVALDGRLVTRIQLDADDNAALSELELRKFSVPIDCPS